MFQRKIVETGAVRVEGFLLGNVTLPWPRIEGLFDPCHTYAKPE